LIIKEKEREQKEMVSEIKKSKKKASNKFFIMINNTSHSVKNN